uniref:Cyclin N-terminal domain-containing protein n=1 Tax=Caenorhabditis japonica TaxID=281687 RepID=A0A8R1DKA0_CAEJA
MKLIESNRVKEPTKSNGHDMELAPESMSAGPSGYGQHIPFIDEQQPCTSSAFAPIRRSAPSTDLLNWTLSPRCANALNDNIRTFIYNRTDPHIQLDNLVFVRLMEHEEALQPNYHYFTAVQEHVTPFHREQAIEWIYDVAKEENCDGDVFLLAVAIIDRFLSFQNILKHDIQMIAGVSLFIASKLKAPHPLTASKIAYYSDNSCPVDMLLQWELLVVTTLQWETESPTAFSFFDHLAARIPAIHNLRGDFQSVVHKCQRMHKLATLFPSMQCAIALYYVSNLPHQNAELAMAISNLLAQMFQLQVNLLDSWIPMVKRCLDPTPIYTSTETQQSQALIPEVCQEFPEQAEEVVEVVEQTNEVKPTVPIFLDTIPESDQTPSTPLNDSGFCSEGSSPSSSEKKRRRSSCVFEDDSTPPKVFKCSVF